MRKSLLLLSLILSIFLFASCGECTEHADANKDGKCDVCELAISCEHSFTNDCDTTCNNEGCSYTREVEHKFDNDCDAACNVEGCTYTRNIVHIFSGECDVDCNTEGCAFTREVPHIFDNDCDESCNTEGCTYTRAIEHKFDNDCDGACNVEGCTYTRAIEHKFDNDCDGACNVEGCTYTRPIEHKFDNDCDGACNVDGCTYTRAIEHKFDNDCDTGCNTEGCGYTRIVLHSFDHVCDPDCNIDGCSYRRTVNHVFDNVCDTSCNTEGCGHVRTALHVFDHDCDRTCNSVGCSYTRETEHRDTVIPYASCDVCAAPLADSSVFADMQSVLLIGQSNMSGRGDVKTVAPIDDDRIYMLYEGEWVKMEEPIHRDAARGGIGLAGSFSKAFVETFGCDLGLIPAAVGGTSLADWAVGGDLYNATIEKAKIAKENSEICAILWHQGEADQNNREYAKQLKVILDAMLTELGLDKTEIVIVTGELFGTRSDAVHKGQLELLKNDYPLYGIAESDGLTVFDVTTHFDSQSLRVFGYRYFDVFYSELTGKHYTFDDNPENYYIEPSYPVDEIGTLVYSQNFNSFLTGAQSGYEHDVYFHSSGEHEIVEINENSKYYEVKNYYDEASSKYTKAYAEVLHEADKNATVVIEAKFKIGEKFEVGSDIFKLINAKNDTYVTIYVDSDAKLYSSMPATSATRKDVCLNYSLDFWEWTTIRLIVDLKDNHKQIFIDGNLVYDGVFTEKEYTEANITKNRFIHFYDQTDESSLIMDDYKFYVAKNALGPFDGTGSGSGGGNGDTPESMDYIYNEGFEKFNVGTVYDSETVANDIRFKTLSSTTYAKIISDGGAGKCVEFVRGTDAINAYFEITNSIAAASKIVVEGRFKLGEGSTVGADLLKLINTSSGGTHVNLVCLDSNGELVTALKDGISIGASLSSTEWTTVKVVADFANNKKDIYVNGALVMENVPIITDSTDSSGLTFRGLRMQLKKGSGTLMVDDVKCYYFE